MLEVVRSEICHVVPILWLHNSAANSTGLCGEASGWNSGWLAIAEVGLEIMKQPRNIVLDVVCQPS